MAWSVYILSCADGTLYTGVAIDVPRRVQEHNESPRGAKYTKSRRPVTLCYEKVCETRSAAQKQEAVIKKMSREDKVRLIESV